MQGDHDELKIFLEIRLIPSRIDQKFSFQRETYIGFKEEIGLEIVSNGGDRGGGLMASRGRFLGCGSWLQFRDESASISPPNIMHFSHDQATIGPRWGHDCATIGPRSWSWSFVDRRPLDWRRFHHVNSPIAVRSDHDRGVLPRNF